MKKLKTFIGTYYPVILVVVAVAGIAAAVASCATSHADKQAAAAQAPQQPVHVVVNVPEQKTTPSGTTIGPDGTVTVTPGSRVHIHREGASTDAQGAGLNADDVSAMDHFKDEGVPIANISHGDLDGSVDILGGGGYGFKTTLKQAGAAGLFILGAIAIVLGCVCFFQGFMPGVGKGLIAGGALAIVGGILINYAQANPIAVGFFLLLLVGGGAFAAYKIIRRGVDLHTTTGAQADALYGDEAEKLVDDFEYTTVINLGNNYTTDPDTLVIIQKIAKDLVTADTLGVLRKRVADTAGRDAAKIKDIAVDVTKRLGFNLDTRI